MMRTVAGTFRQGAVELAEIPHGVEEESPVLVTFLEDGSVSLQERGINAAHAAELRAALASFAADWDSPEMDIYNDYDAARSKR